MKHPALVKTSDQPSFSSANFSPFTCVEAPRASDISNVPSLNLQPNPRGGTVNKITNSSYGNFVGAIHEKKIKQTTKSKTNRLASNALLGPSKRWKRMVCRDPTPSDTPSDSDTVLTVPFAEDATEEEEQDADCVFPTGRFSEDHNVEKWIQCAKYFRWGTHFVLVWRKVLFVRLVRDKHCFVLSLYLCFFKFCNYSFCFLGKLFTSPH